MKKSELKEMIHQTYLQEDSDEKINEGVWALIPERIPEFIQKVEELKDEYHGVVGSDDVFNGLDAAISAAQELVNTDSDEFEDMMSEAEEDEEAAEEEEDVDVDAEFEDEEGMSDEEGFESPDLEDAEQSVQDSLEAALEGAKSLGDEKLVDQIGNTITFFTRAHIVGQELEEEETESLNENKEYKRFQKLAGIIK